LAQRVWDLTMPFSPADQALLLSLFTKGSPSSLRISRVVASHIITGSAISPVGLIQTLTCILLICLLGDLCTSSTRSIDNRAIRP
jgi:hypothetical protein